MGNDHNTAANLKEALVRFSLDQSKVSNKSRSKRHGTKIKIPKTPTPATMMATATDTPSSEESSVSKIQDSPSSVSTRRSNSNSDDSLKKNLKKLIFHLPIPDPNLTSDAIKNKLWSPFQRKRAVNMEVARRTADLEVTVYFKNFEDGQEARLYISRNSMKRLLADLEQSSPSYVKQDKQANKSKFYGPNGQTQKRTSYKLGQCSLGCSEFVAEEDREVHLPKCVAQKNYLVFRKEYEGNELRLAERPKPFIPYGESMLEKDNDEDKICKYGFMYGFGPFMMDTKYVGKDPPRAKA